MSGHMTSASRRSWRVGAHVVDASILSLAPQTCPLRLFSAPPERLGCFIGSTVPHQIHTAKLHQQLRKARKQPAELMLSRETSRPTWIMLVA